MNSLWICYHSLSLLCLAAFAEYDIRHRKIKNAALIPFFFWCLLSIPVNLSMVPIIPAFCFLEAVMGFLFGGLLLLIAAMVSNNGIGGGDIKLAALLGILYGPYGVLFILTAASLSALAFQALERFFYYRKLTSLPFAPFLFLGSIMAVSLQCRF
ncbi:MAG: prepilin peptidase [Hungatella hathewayi]|uniref:prepilin peptidase n=1 Tax=Lachnospiraceae TaxID=186803 RepID=UPI0015F45FD5|nr:MULTISPECIES: prepilin peptidase [Clostridia]MBC5706165.1 prepilin peptidase [Hungatella sp. L36]MBS5243583.1 prepilin peptidase [Hungatella hathewayi]MDB2030153.1 prepilin peptidase [[Clostridium] symbiosum]MDU4973125.1 prepilin peptidase [Hungatella hathewayi]